MKPSQNTAAGHIAAFFTIFIWGTTFISTKILLKSFLPYEILFIRFCIGYIVLLLIYPHFIKTKDYMEELLYAAAGLSGVTLYFLMENIALTYTLASNVGIITSVAPFFTALLAHFFLDGERLHKRFFIGFAVAIIGIILINYNGQYILKLNPKGDILAILACAFWAVYSVLMRRIGSLGYNNIGSSRRVFFYGILFMLPVFYLSGSRLGFERLYKPVNLFNILFLGLGATALCFVIWNWCVRLLGAVKTSVYIYLVPVITIITSYLILHENITPTALLGTLFTLVGLFLSEKRIKTNKQIENKIKEEDRDITIRT